MSVGRSDGRSVRRSGDRAVGRSVGQAFGRAVGESKGGRSGDRSGDWSGERSVGRSVGRSFGRSVGRPVGQTRGRSCCRPVRRRSVGRANGRPARPKDRAHSDVRSHGGHILPRGQMDRKEAQLSDRRAPPHHKRARLSLSSDALVVSTLAGGCTAFHQIRIFRAGVS